ERASGDAGQSGPAHSAIGNDLVVHDEEATACRQTSDGLGQGDPGSLVDVDRVGEFPYGSLVATTGTLNRDDRPNFNIRRGGNRESPSTCGNASGGKRHLGGDDVTAIAIRVNQSSGLECDCDVGFLDYAFDGHVSRRQPDGPATSRVCDIDRGIDRVSVLLPSDSGRGSEVSRINDHSRRLHIIFVWAERAHAVVKRVKSSAF